MIKTTIIHSEMIDKTITAPIKCTLNFKIENYRSLAGSRSSRQLVMECGLRNYVSINLGCEATM